MKWIFLTLMLFIGIKSYSQKPGVPPSVKQKNIKIDKKEAKKINRTSPLQEKIYYLKHLEEYRKENNVPDDFPRYHDTGNPKKDLDTYYQAKQEWIKKNPEKFEKIKHLSL